MFQERTAVFIVRLWIETREIDAEPLWRGVVEHVGTGERQYVSDFRAVDTFIAAHIGQVHIENAVAPERDRRGQAELSGDKQRGWWRHWPRRRRS